MWLSAVAAAAAQISVAYDSAYAKHVIVDPRFLCYNIDIGSMYNGFDFLNAKLQALVRQLGPTVVRIGGTADDYSSYLPDSTNPAGPPAPTGSYTYISNKMWDDVLTFAQSTSAVILWDLNAAEFRTASGAWDPTRNATAFLEYTQGVLPPGVEVWWSIGNEPELWHIKVDATQLAADALTLKKTLGGYTAGRTVYGPSFAGLNTNEGLTYIKGTAGQVNGFTVHNYPLARNCNVPDYMDRAFVDKMSAPLAELYSYKVAYGSPDLVMTLEETGGSYGGGCDNITDRYVSGFWYMHTLGVTAEAGFDRVHRQDIAGWSFTGGMSHYQLVGPPGWTNGSDILTPHPDYFNSVLFKMLVGGTAILNVSVSGSDPAVTQNVSMHLWCGSGIAGGAGSATLVYINPTGSDLTVDLGPGGASTTPRQEYILTPTSGAYTAFVDRVATGALAAGVFDPPASIQDDTTYLNGALLTVDAGGALPEWPLPGKTGSGPLVVPAYTYGFVAFPQARIPACPAA